MHCVGACLLDTVFLFYIHAGDRYFLVIKVITAISNVALIKLIGVSQPPQLINLRIILFLCRTSSCARRGTATLPLRFKLRLLHLILFIKCKLLILLIGQLVRRGCLIVIFNISIIIIWRLSCILRFWFWDLLIWLRGFWRLCLRLMKRTPLIIIIDRVALTLMIFYIKNSRGGHLNVGFVLNNQS
jgi:hypothetical protein